MSLCNYSWEMLAGIGFAPFGNTAKKGGGGGGKTAQILVGGGLVGGKKGRRKWGVVA